MLPEIDEPNKKSITDQYYIFTKERNINV